MSTEPGGRADKLGNTYEQAWAVRLLLGVLAGENRSVTPEPPARPNARADLRVVRTGGGRVVRYQCKRENGTKGKWAPADLVREGVVQAAAEAVERDVGSEFVFVSGDPAPELESLTDQSSRFDGDAEAFWAHLTTDASRGLCDAFARICRGAAADPTTARGRAAGLALLGRLGFELFSRTRGLDTLLSLARVHVDGDAAGVVARLGAFAFANLGTTIDAARLRGHLRDAGTPSRDLAGDPAVAAAVDRLRDRYAEEYRPELIGGELLARPEADAVLDRLDGGAVRVVLVHGPAGAGKSGVLYTLVDRLAARHTPCLPVRLDRVRPTVSAERFGRDALGLPASPAACLAAVAAGGPGVLVIDQLDAIRWTTAHSADAWAVCREAIAEALVQSRLTVVVACRTFDVRDDLQINGWRSEMGSACVEVEVGELSEAQVAAVVGRIAGPPPSPDQRRILRKPHLLSLYCQLVGEGAAAVTFGSATELMRGYWEDRFRRLRAAGCLDEGRSLVAAVVRHMDEQGVLVAPRRVGHAGDPAGVAAKVLRSLGVLREAAGGGLAFAHQSFLDYQLASRLMVEVRDGGGRIADWLVRGRQSLFRRGQLRALLALLREEDPQAFRDAVRDLLLGPDPLRFHLRQLALGALGAVVDPANADVGLVLELAGHERYADHALGLLVSGGTRWFDAADGCGVLEKWVRGEDVGRRNVAVRLMQGVVNRRGERVAVLLRALPRPVAVELTACVLGVAQVEEMPPPLLRLYLRHLRRRRLTVVHVEWARLAAAGTQRVARVVAAYADSCLRVGFARELDRTSGRDLTFARGDEEALAAAAKASPAATWHILYPAYLRLVAWHPEGWKPRPSFDVNRWDATRRRDRLAGRVGRMLAAAGGVLAQRRPGRIPRLLLDALSNRRRRVDRVVLRALEGAPDASAEATVRLLLKFPRLFRAGRKVPGRSCGPARQVLRRFASLVSSATFDRLEDVVLRQSTAAERASFSYQLDRLREGRIWRNYFGLAQYGLLLALPHHRMSPTAAGRLGVLTVKFGSFEAWVRRSRPTVTWGGSPKRQRGTRRPSDAQWLRAVARPFPVRGRTRWTGKQGPVDAGHEQLAGDFGQDARLDPPRFARLGTRLPDGADPLYFVALIDALTATEPPPPGDGPGLDLWRPAAAAEVEAVFRRLPLPLTAALASAVARLVEKRSGEPWGDETWDMLAAMATGHPDPASDAFAVSEARGRGEPERPDVFASGLNCVRGRAVEALAALAYSRSEWAARLEPLVERVMADPHPGVRSVAVGLCLPWLNVDRDASVARFCRFCRDEPDDRALGTDYVNAFIGYTARSHAEPLEPVVRRLLASAESSATEAGASWAAIFALELGRLDSEFRAARSGTAAQRKGLAEAVVDLVAEGVGAAAGAEALGDLFEDPDPSVMRAAAAVFYRRGQLDSQGGPPLAMRYVGSRAFLDDPTPLVRALAGWSGDLQRYAEAVFAAARMLAGPLADQARSLAFSVRADVKTLAAVLLRLYEQAQDRRDERTQDRCMDAWDAILEARVGYDVLAILDS